MKANFTVLERLLILNMLPAENDYSTLKVIRKAKDQIGFDDQESVALNFRTTDENGKPLLSVDGKPMAKWNHIPDKEIELGEKAVDIISGVLKEMNKSKKLTDNHISIYDKVVGDAC